MASYTTTVPVAASPRRVFDYLADFSNTADWDPGVMRASRLDAGVLKVGSSFAVEVKVGPRSLPMTYVIRRFDAPRLLQLTAEEKLFDSLDTITVEPDGEGCRVTYAAVLSLRGPGRFLDPLLQLLFSRVSDRAAVGLRRQLALLADTST